MKTYTKLFASLLALLPACVVESFSASSTKQRARCSARPSSSFHFATNSVSIGSGDGNENDESAYRYILSKARECAFNDAATAAEAKRFLRQILELESGCASGNLAGHDICDNVGELAVVVAHLREKVEANTVLTSHDVHAARTMAGLVAVSMAFAILAEVQWHDDVTPFTMQEWLWAIKGGYLPTMVMQFIRNGGL